MQYWLMKSEPEVWSIDQQKKAGIKGVPWDGVRNYQAAKNLKLINNSIHFKFNCISNYTNHLKITSNKLFSQHDKRIGLNRLKRSILINSIIIY